MELLVLLVLQELIGMEITHVYHAQEVEFGMLHLWLVNAQQLLNGMAQLVLLPASMDKFWSMVFADVQQVNSFQTEHATIIQLVNLALLGVEVHVSLYLVLQVLNMPQAAHVAKLQCINAHQEAIGTDTDVSLSLNRVQLE